MLSHTDGPFYISCGGDLFLKVESDNQLKTTDQLDNASQFSIVRCEQGDEHFNIVYQPPVTENSIPVPSLFLSASKQDASLLMKDTVDNSKLALRSRYTEHFERPAKLSNWVSGTGKEFFYIICTEAPKMALCKRRYLCVFKPSANGLEETDYITGCKPRRHHEKPHTHMLFFLIKPNKPSPHLNENEALGNNDRPDLTPIEMRKDKISEEGTHTTE